jgi:Zn-dependent protease with chaperone function
MPSPRPVAAPICDSWEQIAHGQARMRFHTHQMEARKLSRRLVVLYVLAFVATVAVISFGIAFVLIILKLAFDPHSAGPVSWQRLSSMLFDQRFVIAFAALAVPLLIALPAWSRARELKRGSSRLLAWLGAKPLPRGSTDPDHQRLRNVVEEMSIASGIPTPSIHVFEHEDGINAMAIGFDPSHAALAVTRGCLLLLDRDELQAVVAHEFSHILNGDMRLNTRMLAPLYGLIWLSAVARYLSFGKPGAMQRSNQGGKKEFTGIPHFWSLTIPVWLLGAAGAFCSRAIKASTFRQRERLADASAVQFTRQTQGIAGALKKMAALGLGARFTRAYPEDASHMLFGDGLGAGRWLSTHPPVLERIRAVSPGFHPRELESTRRLLDQRLQQQAAAERVRSAQAQSLAEMAQSVAWALPAAAATFAVTRLADRVGEPGMSEVEYARQLRQSVPDGLAAAAAESDSARALVLALLVSLAPGEPEALFELIESEDSAALAGHVRALLPQVRDLHPALRLPLIQIAAPALRDLPDHQRVTLSGLIDRVIHAHGHVGIFEYALGRMLQASLSDRAGSSFGTLKLVQAQDALGQLLAVLAHAGHSEESEARRAWTQGMHRALPGHSTRFPTLQNWSLVLDTALPRLDRLDPLSKELLLESMLVTIRHDGVITIEEGDLLRAVCSVLHCPLPPLLGYD